MTRRLPVLATLAASLVVAACGGAPATPTLTDPVEILAESVAAVQDATSVTVDAALDGTIAVDLTGSGSPQPFPLDGASASATVDLAEGDVRATFVVPSFLNLAGELIQVGDVSWLRTSMTGPLYQRQDAGGALPVDPDELTGADLDLLRDTLAMPELAPVKGDDVDCGPGRCYTVVIELTPEEMASLGVGQAPGDLPADLSAATVTISVVVDHRTLLPAGLELVMDLGAEGSATVDLTFSGWNEPVAIEPPPAGEVAPAP